jgi:ubiquinone/menaquinone biosynthesis C-methylase UbiE
VACISCGGGSWLFDMATNFRQPTFIGVDISPVIPQGIKPQNVEFVLANVLDGLPFQDDSFDYVHQRFLIAGIPSDKWQDVVDEIVRVLKPGGYLEVLENTKNHSKHCQDVQLKHTLFFSYMNLVQTFRSLVQVLKF